MTAHVEPKAALVPDLAAAAGVPPWMRFLQPLKIRDFRLVWMGESLSLVGDQFYFVALAWLTLQLTGSGLALGTVEMTAALPRGVLMLVGGAVTDRFSPRKIMLGSNAVRAFLVGIVAGLVLSQTIQLWELYVLAAAFGTVDALFFPATASITPLLVDEQQLPAATGLVNGSAQLSVLIGPALAGVLIASLGSFGGNGTAFAIDSLSFALAAMALALMREDVAKSQSAQDISDPSSTPGILKSIGEGLLYAWRDPVLRMLLFMICAIDFAFVGSITVGLASLAHNRFAGGSIAFGTMIAAFGGGALAGTVAGGSMGRPRHRGWITSSCVLISGCGLFLLGFVPNIVLAVTVILCIGVGSGFINILMVPWLQTRTEQRMMGRVMSLIMFSSLGLAPVSYALAGIIVDINVTLLFVGAGLLTCLAGLAGMMSRHIRTID